LRANLPPGHIAFASLASEQALIAQCRGDLRNALNLANQAVEIVQGSAKAGRGGTEFLQLFLMRRSGIELDMHRVDEAVTDAEHALNMARHSAPSGAFSSYLGWDYLALGRALKAQGKRQQARAALQSASEHLQGTLGPDHPETRAARQLINDLDSLH
jgi:tetratricopeptide (TPR) repeat protein